MRWSFDWKYVLGTVIALAALALPAYQWQSDLNPHSLSVRKLSSSPLQPFANSKTYDVKMLVNGVELTNPFFNTFEIVNTGSKPILSSDFDTPIEFVGKDGLQFVSARVDATDPKEIPVKISSNSRELSIAPFLSNPADRVIFSTITAGPNPEISVKARIAGVRQISVEDTSVARPDIAHIIISVIQCLASLLVYVIFAWIIPRLRRAREAQGLSWRFLLVAAMCSGLGGTTALTRTMRLLEPIMGDIRSYSVWVLLGLTPFLFVAGYWFSKRVYRRTGRIGQSRSSVLTE